MANTNAKTPRFRRSVNEPLQVEMYRTERNHLSFEWQLRIRWRPKMLDRKNEIIAKWK